MLFNLSTLRAVAKGVGDVEKRLDAVASLLEAFADSQVAKGEVARKSTSQYYVRNTNKSQRQKLNDAAVGILTRIRSGELRREDLTEGDKIAMAHYSGCGGGLIGSDGKKGSAYEYYTPKAVAEGVWDVVKSMGFGGGKVLDPCSGVGIFGATSPSNCTVDACELNPDSGKINSLLNDGPGYRTHIGPFEEFASAIPDNSYDAVVSNVPFGDAADRGANRFKDAEFQDCSLEVYFILKALKKLRPGGIAALIAPVRCVGTGTDGGAKMRDMRVQTSMIAEFIGAYRLPSGTFSDAQTDTVTDVIFYRKYSESTQDKIKELAAQNPAILSDANVLWPTYINGKYFTTAEGKKYIFGTEGTKKGQFGDVYAVIADSQDGKVNPSDVKDLMKLKRLPSSRINWDILEQAETAPITYKEGDIIVQGGATLVMQGGEWVVQRAEHDPIMASALGDIATPYRAFENGVSLEKAREVNAYYSARCANLDLPLWFRSAMAVLDGHSDRSAKKYWKQSVIALSCDEVREDRNPEGAFNFLEAYPALSSAMKAAKATESDGRKCGGYVGDSIRRLSKLYGRTVGYSAYWRGDIEAEVKRSVEQAAFMQTEDGRLAGLHYSTKSVWLKVDDVKKIKGESFDPFKDDDWAMNANGEICEASDYYAGNLAEFLTKLDADIEAAKTPEIKAKLVHQRMVAEERVVRPNVKALTFDLRSPYVRLEDKLEFLRSYGYMPNAVIGEGKRGQQIIAEPRGNSRSREVKIRRSFEHYLTSYTIRVGAQRFDDAGDTPEEKRRKNDEAIEEVRKIVETANIQFNDWVKANRSIQERIEANSNKPENCYFRYEEDSRPLEIPGIRTKDDSGNPVKLHDYQTAFVRKMGRGFEGINAFGVGLGKTFTALAAVQYAQSIGAKKKTLFVVPKAVFSNWQKEANWVYTNPDDCLFVGMRKNKSGKNAFSSSAVLEDFDAIRDGRYSKIFMTMPVFEKLRMKEETVDGYLRYLESTDAALQSSMKKAEDEATEGKREKIGHALTNKSDKSAPFIEDLGIDSLVIDEAHFMKNAAEAQAFGRDIVSLSLSQASRRGMDALAKAWYFRQQSPKRDGVLLLTATPITNSPLEMFSMLSLAVGADRVNKLCCGTSGPDQFLEMVCDSKHDSIVKLDASKQDAEVFTGLKNVEMLRGAIRAITTFKDAEALGAAKVEREILANRVVLPEETKRQINRYRRAYQYAKADDTTRYKLALEDPSIEGVFREVREEFNEEESVMASPFNLLLKMQNEISDPELNLRASFYTFSEANESKVNELIDAWNALDKTETANKLSRFVNEGDIKKQPKNAEAETVAAWVGQDEDDAGEGDKWTYIVRAVMLETGLLRLNAQTYQTQDAFEKLAEKMGIDLSVKPSAKQWALIENIRKEMSNPRGLISRDPRVSSPIVKQIVFCDNKASHCKLRKMITQSCGISAAKIAVVTGDVNSSVDEILDVQNGFNAQGEENKYQLIIANKKAEVGINLQKGTQAIHHLTIGWTPDSIEQRNGRGARQGNATESVAIYFYDAENTFDEVKRGMVNKKSNWINSVVSENGGNKVDVARKFTNEDYEALAGLASDDPNAVQKFVEAREKAEAEQRRREVEKTQRICLETIEANRNWLLENRSEGNVIKEFLAKAYKARFKLAKARNTLEAKIAAGMSESRLNKYREAVKDAEAAFADIEEAMLASYDLSQSQFGSVWDLLSAVGAGYGNEWEVTRHGVKRKPDGLLMQMWKTKRETAQGLIESAVKTYAEKSSEPGGENANIAVAKANGTLVDTNYGHTMWKDCFVRCEEDGRLGLVASAETIIYAKLYGGRWVWERANASNFKNGVVIYPDTPEYEDALVEAGKIENNCRKDGARDADGFSAALPLVGEYVGEVIVDTFPCSLVRLPSPHFPYIILEEWAEGAPVLNDIVNEQKEYVDSFIRSMSRPLVKLKKLDGVRIADGNAPANLLMCEVFPAIVTYAKNRGAKLTLADTPYKKFGSWDIKALSCIRSYILREYIDRDDARELLKSKNFADPSTFIRDCRKALLDWMMQRVDIFDWSTFDVDPEEIYDALLGHDCDPAIWELERDLREKLEENRSADLSVGEDLGEDVLLKSKRNVDALSLEDAVVVTNVVPGSMKTRVWHKALVFHKNYGAKYSPKGCKKHPEYGAHTWTFKKSEWLRLLNEHPEVADDLFARPAN